MNILDMYDNYRSQHIAEFRSLLEDVAKSVLNMTENFPEEEALEVFEKSSCRKWMECYESKKKGFLHVEFGDSEHECPYDNTAAKALDRFMERYYPNIVCSRWYYLDLYRRTIRFVFEFKLDNINYDDEIEVRHKGDAIKNSISLFNDDVAELLQQKFDESDWLDFDEFDKGISPYDQYYKYGIVHVDIEIN